jgi:GIY-YIG catalytic domain-containing protein
VNLPAWPTLADLPRPDQFKSEDDLAQESRPVCGLYILINLSGDVVYVGQSSNIQARLRQHRRDATKKFRTLEYYPLDSELSRLQLEAILILALLPRHNRALALGLAPGKVWELAYSFNARPRTRRSDPKG